MYQPDHFRVADLPKMHALMRARPLATLVSAGSVGLYATHLPTVLKDDGPYGIIECHLARANPHWKDLAEGNEALMIFQGSEGYITPRQTLVGCIGRASSTGRRIVGKTEARSYNRSAGPDCALLQWPNSMEFFQ